MAVYEALQQVFQMMQAAGINNQIINLPDFLDENSTSSSSDQTSHYQLPTFLNSFRLCNGNQTDSVVRRDIQSYMPLLPALVCIFILSFIKPRKSSLCGGCCFGRPSIAFPVKLLEDQRKRVAYVAAFCITGFQILGLLKDDVPFSWYVDIPSPAKGVTKLCICFYYGFLHYPIFASLSSYHFIGYLLGTLHTWLMFSIYWAVFQPCWQGNAKDISFQFFTFIPPALCYAYLSLYLPYIMIRAIVYSRTPKMKKVHVYEEAVFNVSGTLKMLEYHKKLSGSRHKAGVWYYLEMFQYRNIPGFRYGLSILCGVWLAIVTTYMMGLSLLKETYFAILFVKQVAKAGIEDPQAALEVFSFGILSTENSTRIAEEVYYWTSTLEACVYVCTCIGFLLMVASMLASLRRYRDLLLCIYRGVNIDVPLSTSNMAPSSILVSGCKYVGFQVGYAVWGYLIMVAILMIISLAISIFISAIVRYHAYGLIPWICEKIGPLLALMLVLNITQSMVATFFFLQKDEHGNRVLALTNRRVFFNFHYYVIFINAALGLISCLMRILEAVIFGIWILPRLDLSTMPRQFERFDSGYASYINLLQLENAQTNPLMITFINLMYENLENSRKRQNGHITSVNVELRTVRYVAPKTYRKAIVMKWRVALLLHNNLYLQYLRKKTLVLQAEMSKEREELAKTESLIQKTVNQLKNVFPKKA